MTIKQFQLATEVIGDGGIGILSWGATYWTECTLIKEGAVWYVCTNTSTWHGGHPLQAKQGKRKYAWVVWPNTAYDIEEFNSLKPICPFVSEDDF